MTELLGQAISGTLTTGPIEEAGADHDERTLLVGVRAGRNEDFDRLVLDFAGPLPGFRVQYVDRLVEDGTGDPVPLRGRAVVEITLQPAAAHRDDGTPTWTGPLPDVTGFAAFRQIADAGDSEAVLTWGIGVAAETGLRVTTLRSPTRVAVDVVHAEPGTGDRLLRRGDRGAAVATWQWRLAQALDRRLDVDEVFGAMTEQATRNFQGAQGLTADGLVGPRTRAAMVRALGL
ncbi:peptidoglycan-binding domain-containing protein [Geodermatophilus marinus]|uniref:peptidoglycan-binding domain-containing protein n=1 Tax=Geodermatophilus sp. LHW52908 TaxID=2303986 RepID=UPI001F2BE7A4|nr:peptidoglycan-binding domain-containing protein [Geodermatophilus sp. LHW52908]